MHGPNRHSAKHHRRVHWMADAVIHQVRGFWQSFRQHAPRKSLAYTLGVWNSNQIVFVIKSFYNNFKCRVWNCESYVGVALQPDADWMRRQITSDRSRGIEDLDFTDDLWHSSKQTRKITRLGMSAQQVGLKTSQKKTEVIMLNVPNTSPVKVNGESFLMTEEFTYLGSTARHDVGASSDIRNYVNKAMDAFRMLTTVWTSSQYRTKRKTIRLLLYRSQCRRMTENDLNKLSTFHTKILRRNLEIFWPKTNSNQHLAPCSQDSMDTIIRRRRWRSIGHVIRSRSVREKSIVLNVW